MKRYRHYKKDKAIVLSCFGSVIEQQRYLDLKEIVKKEFLSCDVYLSFSSRMVLKHLARKDEKFKNLAQVLADVDMLGYKHIVVSSINLFPTDEHEFMKKIVDGFASFSLANINYTDAILTKTKQTSRFLKDLYFEISHEQTANLFVIHGTPKLDTLGIESINYCAKYLEFLDERNFAFSLEGAFAYSDVKDVIKENIRKKGFKKVQVIPMLLVSGNHYEKDMHDIKDDFLSDFDSSMATLEDQKSFNLLGVTNIQDIVLENIKETFTKSGYAL
ncbi:sirohydrochlorin cobaltochelatase [Sulfurimonas sp.]|uniref:sirohydrochlorin cobaltochelatase n=1 Tax=Sulfurimonas sp. TaxID=2022749 RepID=UPI0026212812|nr:sirohydrochlorin cobaltochelatase [Sulfurimonas sp.]